MNQVIEDCCLDAAQEIVAKVPADCSSCEIRDFLRLVEQGGEVAVGGLERRVASAVQLAFLRRSGRLIAIAGLKRPSTKYRKRVANSSGVDLPQDAFPYELGWVFVDNEARGKGFARPLSEAALFAAGDCGVFATSRRDNAAMHRVLFHLGFLQTGAVYASANGGHQLMLFTRVASQSLI